MKDKFKSNQMKWNKKWNVLENKISYFFYFEKSKENSKLKFDWLGDYFSYLISHYRKLVLVDFKFKDKIEKKKYK